MSSRMSKDRVKFVLPAYYFEYVDKIRALLTGALGVTPDQYVRMRDTAQINGMVEVICRPSQFARFLIMREKAGYQNMFKELKAELIVPVPPVVQPIDLSTNPPKPY
jgi:hypothetical protein